MTTLLKESHAFSGFAVPDLDAAKKFYGETLGLDVTTGSMDVLELHLAGGNHVLIYPKPDHVAAKTSSGECMRRGDVCEI